MNNMSSSNLNVCFGLLGEHLQHSFSCEIHKRIGLYDYKLIEVAQSKLDTFMRKRDFAALNVTIPYKQAVIKHLDEISEQAKTIGAVNTIVNRAGKLCGHNTDFAGMRALIEKMGINLHAREVLILGSGGTSNTAHAVAKSLGAGSILKVSRATKAGYITYEQAQRQHAGAQIVINTTPCGMFPNTFESPVDLRKFENLEGVLDAVYNPLSTMLVLKAQKLGVKAAGGLYMLVAQAVCAAEIFTGKTLGTEIIDEIYEQLLQEKRNIVLVGLPACGKTVAGKRLAKLTGRKFVDTDSEIEKREGMSIPEIFSQHGQAAFREAEAKVVASTSKENGIIIATGGGAVLQQANIDALKTNGVVVFIDRNPSALQPSCDRPLFNEKGKMEKLYAQRYPLYMACADIHFKADCAYEVAGDKILELLDSTHLKRS